ncbi:hypothetical protein CR513_61678, partial [Mucuna pruriens]
MVHPFFHLLQKLKTFRWSEECEKAFTEFRTFLASPLILTKPKEGQNLFYNAETRYQTIEKLAIALSHGHNQYKSSYLIVTKEKKVGRKNDWMPSKKTHGGLYMLTRIIKFKWR